MQITNILIAWVEQKTEYLTQTSLEVMDNFAYLCMKKIMIILSKAFKLQNLDFLLFAGKSGSDRKSVGQDLQNTDQHRLVLFTC